jgi:hypothetical protein
MWRQVGNVFIIFASGTVPWNLRGKEKVALLYYRVKLAYMKTLRELFILKRLII